MQSLPDGFNIPLPFFNTSFHIYFYGILIMLGVVAAAFLAQAEAKRRGVNPDYIWDALFWIVLAGIVGARLWHIFTPQKDMLVPDPVTGKLVNPYFVGGVPRILDIINIRNGGLGIPGAIIGGLLALWLYCRNKKISFLTLVDTIIPGVALAQAIGRWGNFFNQELYGKPTTLPWGIHISAAHRIDIYTDMTKYPATTLFHPLFLYESIWNLINMALLLWLARRFEKWLKGGDLLYIYMMMYSIGRFCLDYLRVGTISFNHIFIAIVALAGGVLFFLNHRPPSTVAA
ncbi:MAG: prolipoprotein diacylglyceryl transferase [Anaerolineales bacterium]|jgi:phosphatidylglycerol:prolipoprotein diacylglycerol transferase